MRLREANDIAQRATVERAVYATIEAAPTVLAMRGGSVPNDGASGGYELTTEPDDVVVYYSWFGPGDYPDTNLVRPF